MNQDNGGVIGKINTPTTLVASGVWSIQDQFEAQSSSTWPLAFPQTTFTNTCRFNQPSSDYLNRTHGSSPTSRQKWTFSTWIKRGKLSATSDVQKLFSTAYVSLQEAYLYFDGTNRLNFGQYESGGAGNNFAKVTNRIFRDTNAYYHIQMTWDTTQSTASDRIKFYVNGQQETSFATDTAPSLNYNGVMNTNVAHYIGSNSGASQFFDGYLAETIFVDGQGLSPTSFGATNPITNIWEPIAYKGTYGTNGFKLNYSDSSALGDDTSGNGNDWTVNNLTSIDQSTDTPSNNFCTLSRLDIPTNSSGSSGTLPTLTNANLSITNTSSAFREVRSTYYLTTGKWYWEAKVTRLDETLQVGVVLSDYSAGSGSRRMYQNNGNKYTPNSSSYGASFTTNDIVGIALNLDDGEITFYKNGSTQGVAATDLISGIDVTGWTPAVNSYDGDCDLNFGSPPYAISSGNADANGHGNFEYAVPSGYFALNTKNLSEFG